MAQAAEAKRRGKTKEKPTDKDALLKAYRIMLLIRRFEEKAGQLYGMGLIGGFCHLYIGQEAVVVGMQAAIGDGDQVITSYRDHGHMLAAGMEARGFILGGAVAHQLSAGFVPIRKKGKLPWTTVSVAYSLEYGIDEMELHEDAVAPGERVILVDDLIATGGTAEGAVKLLKSIGADVVAACFVIDLPELGGAQKIRDLGVPVRTLVSFDGH